jgi:hypothetical protein
VLALTVYAGELIAGGYDFRSAGGMPCNYIARWNGSAWHPLGSGMDDPVWSLTVYPAAAGELIAGGDFTTAGDVACSHIARWNGNTWQSLGPGMNGPVYGLAAYNDELIAGGYFWTAGGVGANYIAAGAPVPCIGDLNCDGIVDFGDINPFVTYLTDVAAWHASYPGCDEHNGDVNGDDLYPDFGDINPFVQLIASSPLSCP